MNHKLSFWIIGIITSILIVSQVVPTLISSNDWVEFITGAALAVLIGGYLITAVITLFKKLIEGKK